MTAPQHVNRLAQEGGSPMGQQEVRIMVHRLFGEPKEFTLTYPLSPEHDAMLAKLHREFSGRGAPDGQVIEDLMHPRLPRATPGRPGGWLTIASISDPRRGVNARRWRLGHWPGSGLSGGHNVPSMKSALHAGDQEYHLLRVGEHGGGVHGATEKSLTKGVTVSDVVAYDQGGNPIATFEIQHSGLASGTAVRRDNAIGKLDIPISWYGPTDTRPEWAPRVAWLGANRREGLARGSWTVASGRRELELEPCRPGARQDCPFGRNWCGEEHLMPVPKGGTVDDIIHGLLSGDLVRFDSHTKRGIFILSAADRERWVDQYGTSKAERLLNEAARREASKRVVLHNDEYPEAKILAAMGPAAARKPPTCPACRKPKWAIADGLCMQCRWDLGIAPGSRPVAESAPAQQSPSPYERAVQRAQSNAVALVPSMRSHEELLNLWHLAEKAGTVTQELRDACRRRDAELRHGAA